MDLPVSVMTAADLNSGLQPKVSRVKLLGCTNRDQAWRWAYYHLMSTKLSLRTIQFAAAIEAVCCSVGSVIATQADVTQWAVGGRVQAGSTLTTLNVERTDLAFAPSAGWTVSVQHPVIERGTATIHSVVGQAINFTAALPSGRIVKAVGPDGTEYVANGYSSSQITLAYSAGTLAAGQVVTLYDTNVIDNMDVLSVAITPAAPNTYGGSVITISGQFSGVPCTDSAWAYGQSAGYQPAKLFRVINMKKSGDFSFEISALEYNATAYTDVIPNYGEIVGVPTTAPVILNLTLTEQYQNGTLTGSTNSAIVAVGWQNSNTAVGAQVQVQAGNGKPTILGNIQGQGCTFVGYIGTVYTVTVTGLDWANNLLGAPVTASITVVASTNAPADVTGFNGNLQGSATGGSTILTWNAAAGADHYEIRYATDSTSVDWTTAEVLWDGTALTWTDTVMRSGAYLIKAISSLATGSVESVDVASYSNTTSSSGLNGTSIPPGAPFTVTVPINTNTSGSCSISLNAASQSLLRPDGSTFTTVATTLSWTGLLAATTYYFYTCVSVATGALCCAGATPPTAPDSSPNGTHALQACADGFYQGPIITVTTPASSGTGGSSGGNQSPCPDSRELVQVRERGTVEVGNVQEGEHILGRHMALGIDVFRKVIRRRIADSAVWYRVGDHRMSPLDPVWVDGEWKMPYRIGTFDGEPGVRVKLSVEADEYDQQNYWLVGGAERLLIHNQTIMPS